MTGLVNFASEPGSVELREVPVPELDEESLLLSVQAVVCAAAIFINLPEHRAGR
jgi:hypothetical protein